MPRRAPASPADGGRPDVGLFGPGSVTWKVNREAVLLLGGGRALLMQVAHPLVAAGVADHSDFERDPIGRLRRTLDGVLAIAFGTSAEAARAVRAIDARHATVRGTLADAVPGRDGASYRAEDPELLLWVHATLVDTALLVYRRYVGPLGDGESERYYEETKEVARLFRIPARLVPADLDAFHAYVERMIAEELFVTPTARAIARSILHPPIRYVPATAFETLNLVTAGLLPNRLREAFGLGWGAARQMLFDASALAVRTLLPVLPDLLRAMPPARAADRRIATAA